MAIASLVTKNRLLSLGDTGPAVVALQKALAQLGYALSGTGYFGQGTDTAVTAFQRRAGISQDGVVGPDTATAIDRWVAAQAGKSDADLVTPRVETSRPLWLEAGIKLIGTHEGLGRSSSVDNTAATSNRVIINWAKDEGGDIAKEYTHDSIPWCALFANHCLSSVGLKGTGTLWALDFAGKWPSIKLAGPAVGAFAPMTRNGGGHIIQIVGRDQGGNYMGLGGNQSDQVSIEPFPQSRLNHGFWWPKTVPLPKQTGFSTLPVVRSDGRVSTNEA